MYSWCIILLSLILSPKDLPPALERATVSSPAMIQVFKALIDISNVIDCT